MDCGGACGCPGGPAGDGERDRTYVLEAAPDAGLDVGAPEGGHLAQLSWDLDGVVQQQAQLPLVARVPSRRHLVEQVWRGRERERGGERGLLDFSLFDPKTKTKKYIQRFDLLGNIHVDCC